MTNVKPLSNIEIITKLDKYHVNVQFVPYHHIKMLKSIDQILPCVLLYEHHFPIGHFVALFRNIDGVNYFDPTGRIPDELIKYNFDNPN